ncbi:MAG: hypothetical protein BWY04_01498 [candidate division CPR1 bacterium ADurb.Bin160]|uniref:Lipoprotein n=1 Tax=candidate division CPR1 bacterium ADurb.Bin160 TaxID=1852826 RepID=A0A1V5ZIB8_9BACT|nr:MAG: hypothetical protein BWY04_01498 [candidate division CPR1 bacterium ADurb.Bin160]
MKKTLLVILVLIFIAGCSSLDSRGFYSSGEKQGIHKATGTEYDVEGYDQSGYDKNGYNKEGYDKNGFNKKGYNASGYDEKGYNKEGYDQSGYDKNGYNKEGYDNKGFNKEGYNASGYDEKGYNKEGYDQSGYDKNGYNKEGYDNKGFNKEGYNASGYDEKGYNKEGYDQGGYDKTGYNKEGYNIEGWSREGINKNTGTKYDENGYDINGNSPYVFHSNNNIDLEVVHRFIILVTDNNEIPLKNVNIQGNLKNRAYYEDVYNKEYSIITDEQGKAKVIGTMDFINAYGSIGTPHESNIEITTSSNEYFSVNKIQFEIEGDYKKSDYKTQSKEVKVVLTPKTTEIHRANINVVDIEGISLEKVEITGKMNEKEIKEKTDKKGILVLKNSDFEIVELEKNNSTEFDLKYSKDGYYNNSDSFSIYEKWKGKTITEDRKVTLYKPDDYFKKEFLNESKFKSLRSKIKLFLDGILLQSWIKDANVPYRSIGVYEFKSKKYIELNLTSTVVYNSLKSNKYDIGKSLFGELVVKMLDSLVMIEDENISGVNLRVTGYTKSFAEKYASNTAIKYDFIMEKATIRKYKDKDITSQKLLDESVILMDNERIELKLQ